MFRKTRQKTEAPAAPPGQSFRFALDADESTAVATILVQLAEEDRAKNSLPKLPPAAVVRRQFKLSPKAMERMRSIQAEIEAPLSTVPRVATTKRAAQRRLVSLLRPLWLSAAVGASWWAFRHFELSLLLQKMAEAVR